MDFIQPMDINGIKPASSDRIADETIGFIKRNVIGYNEALGTAKDPAKANYESFLQGLEVNNLITMIDDTNIGKESNYFSNINVESEFDAIQHRIDPRMFSGPVSWSTISANGNIPPTELMISIYDRGSKEQTVLKSKALKANFIMSGVGMVPKAYRDDFEVVK